MKKIIGIIVVLGLAVAAWASATYYMGGEVEKQYFAFLDQYSRQQPYVVLKNKSYRRGFLQSTAETVVTMPQLAMFVADKEREDPSFSFVLVHTLRHGPLPFGKTADGGMLLKPCLAYVETHFPESAEDLGDLAKLFNNLPEVGKSYSYCIFNFAGKAYSRSEIPPINFQSATPQGDIQFGFQGMSSEGYFSPDLSSFTGTATSPLFTMKAADQMEMRMTNMNANYNLTKGFEYIYLGDMDMTLDSMEMQVAVPNAVTEQVLLKNLKINTTSSSDGDLLNYRQAMRFESLKAAGKVYGPAVLDVEARKINAHEFMKLQQEMQSMQTKLMNTDKEEMQAVSKQIMQLYANMLCKGSPEYNIRELKVSTPQGDIAFQLQVRLNNVDETVLQNPTLLVNHLEAEAGIAADEQLVRALANFSLKEAVRKQLANDPSAPVLTEEQIDTLVDQQVDTQLQNLTTQQFLVFDNNSYKAQAAFKQGVLTVNGRQIPIPGQRYSSNDSVMH